MTLRARGEQAGVALEVARGALPTRASASPSARGVNLAASQRTDASQLRAMSLFLDIGQGTGLAGADGRPAVPPAAARGRAGAWGRRASTSTAPTSAFLESTGLPRGDRGRGRRPCSSSARPALGGRTRRGRAPLDMLPGVGARRSARCCSPARSPTAGSEAGSGSWPAPLLRRARLDRGRRPVRARARAARRRTRRPAPASTPTARRCSSPAVAIFVPPLAFLAIAGVRRCSSLRRRAGARARSTPACASCGDVPAAQEARPRRHRLAEAGHARPGRRRGPGAGARGAARARHLHARLRVDLPVGRPRWRRPRSRPASARPTTTSRR